MDILLWVWFYNSKPKSALIVILIILFIFVAHCKKKKKPSSYGSPSIDKLIYSSTIMIPSSTFRLSPVQSKNYFEKRYCGTERMNIGHVPLSFLARLLFRKNNNGQLADKFLSKPKLAARRGKIENRTHVMRLIHFKKILAWPV